MIGVPETRYARAPDGAFIAFQVFGAGPVDVLLMPGYFTNLDENWRMPEIADAHRRIATFARVIIMDRRGVGLSDRLAPGIVEPLETHVDDLVSVLDAVRVSAAYVVASESAASLALLFAATRPDRTRGLALYAPIPANPGRVRHGKPELTYKRESEERALRWGTPFAREDLEEWAPSVAGDPDVVERWGAYLRAAASPGSALAVFDQWWETDVRGIYPSVRVPTLLLYRPDVGTPAWFAPLIEEAATELPDATLVRLSGRDLPYWWGDREEFVAELEQFLTGSRATAARDARRALATVLFTDIVGSTQRAAASGDRAWTDLLARHHALVRDAIGLHRGTEIDTAGDGFLATFDGPARAVRAGLDAAARLRDELGLPIRAGVHTGEVEFDGRAPKGLAVHIGARVAARAGPSEVWVSSTVRDLTAGSGLVFEDAGEHELKGVPDRWRLYRVVG